MINLSSDIVEVIGDFLSQSIMQLWVVIALLLSIPISFYVLRRIIMLIAMIKR